jgi:hypothetical protein
MKKLIILLIGIVAFTYSVKAQSGATAQATANVTATVVEIVTVTKNVDMNFGTFASGVTAGTISIETNGVRNITGGVVALPDNAGSSATFTVNGPTNSQYSITLPDQNSIVITKTGTGNQMVIKSFVHNAIGVLNSGAETFNVGAVLDVPASTPAGVYTGTFDVVVALQ